MPLPLLAAAATQAATLFSYNRQNYMYNRGQQVTRAFTGLNYKLQQFALYRQDIRDLVGLTTDKMSNYHVVACLELGMCATLMGPARLKADVPEWILWHQLVSLCAAFAYLVCSMWFATRAAVAADSFNVRLQTQWIRLPVPDDELLDSALTRAEDFETEGMAEMLRVPMATALFRKVFHAGGGGAKESGEGAAVGDEGGEANEPRQGALQHIGSSMSLNSLTALQMYQQLQRNWSCYDAYARVTMSVGTYWLAISLAYYEIGWTLCHQHKGLPAIAAAMMFCGVIILLIYVDVFLSSQRLAGVALLVIAGPAFAAIGASMELHDSHATHWCSVACGLIHLALSIWFWHVGSIVPGKADLPTRFKGVVYLDIFGPIVRQIRSYLDQTGLGQHAVVSSEDAGDAGLGAPAAKAATESSPTSAGQAKHRWQCVGDACRAAEAAGVAAAREDGLKAAPTPGGVRRDVRRVRRLLLDWKEGAVGQHLGEKQRQELYQMFSEVDAAHRRLQSEEAPQVVGVPVSKHADAGPVGFGHVAGSQQRSRQKTLEYCDTGPAGFGGAAGSRTRYAQEEPPTILRSLSASSNGPHTPVWTRVERDRQGTGRCEYWVGSGKSLAKDGKGKACFNDSPPKDAPFAEFKDVQALCGEVLARAERLDLCADRDRFLQGAAKDASPSSIASLLPRCSGGGEEDSPQALLEVPKNNRHRKGHQPVVAYRVMSASLVAIWLIGFIVHLVRLPEVRAILSGPEVGDFGGSRRLGGPPLAAFSWPEPFFRPRGLHCEEEAAVPDAALDFGLNSSLRLVASNGFLVYRLGAAGAAVGSSLQLACPVEEHDALVSSHCEGSGECRAVVAADGALWECLGGGKEAPARPLASLPKSYVRPEGAPLARWAAAGKELQVFFAAPRRGNIVQLRRRGSELRPVAELELPRSAPVVEEWLSLAVARSSGEPAEDLLLAVAAPGPTMVAWSLSTGKHLGAWPLRGLDSRDGVFGDGALGWCATASGSLFSASAIQDAEAGGVELAPWPLPRMA